MDFYQDNGPSGVSACDDIEDRSRDHTFIVLYEDESSANGQYENITLSDSETYKSISKISKSSIKSKITKVLNKAKNYILSRPKKIFLKGHQFFGCSHLMSVRFFLYSIKTCEFRAMFCRDLDAYKLNKCFNSKRASSLSPPVMGYFADRSSDFYKKSNGNFYLTTGSVAPYCIN